jgi:hypothetical protein
MMRIQWPWVIVGALKRSFLSKASFRRTVHVYIGGDNWKMSNSLSQWTCKTILEVVELEE